VSQDINNISRAHETRWIMDTSITIRSTWQIAITTTPWLPAKWRPGMPR